VHVYTNVDTASGALTPARVVSGVVSASGLAVDTARDRLYVADVSAGIRFVGSASASSTTTAGTVPIPNAHFATVDAANDRLYVGAYDKAYILDGASALVDGTLPKAAVGALAPAGSSIMGFAFR